MYIDVEETHRRGWYGELSTIEASSSKVRENKGGDLSVTSVVCRARIAYNGRNEDRMHYL